MNAVYPKSPMKPKKSPDENLETFDNRLSEYLLLKKQWKKDYTKIWRENNSDRLKIYKKEYDRQNYSNTKEKRNSKIRSLEQVEQQRQLWRDSYYRKKKLETLDKRRKRSEYSLASYHKKKIEDPEWFRATMHSALVRYHYRKKNDVQFNSRTLLRASLNNNLKRHAANKSTSISNLIGCTIEEFISYIQSQFVEGMTWKPKNFHLDHIKPCSSFDLTDPEQQKLCFHYTNFQPLWPTENLKKHSKLNWKR